MKTMRGVFEILAVAALLTAGVQPASATPARGVDSPRGHAIRVMNNSATAVHVFVQDARGRVHDLGRVASDARETLMAPTELAGPFKIEVRPVAPVWAPWTSPEGIGTHALNLPDGATVNFWVETDLRNSRIEIPRG